MGDDFGGSFQGSERESWIGVISSALASQWYRYCA